MFKALMEMNQGVKRLVGGLTRVKTIVDFVLPRTHLNDADELRLQHRFLVEARKKSGELVANEMGLCFRTCIQR
jgi:hypothetical protein